MAQTADIRWKDGQTEGGMVARKGKKEEGGEEQGLVIMKMTPVLLPGFTPSQCVLKLLSQRGDMPGPSIKSRWHL